MFFTLGTFTLSLSSANGVCLATGRQLFSDDFAGLVNLSPELQPKLEGLVAKCSDVLFLERTRLLIKFVIPN